MTSIMEVKRVGGFASINLLSLPGVTDRPEEVEALFELVKKTRLDLIQWRNLNIDPEIYLKTLGLEPPKERMGIEQLIKELKLRFPRLKHGYFNPKIRCGTKKLNPRCGWRLYTPPAPGFNTLFMLEPKYFAFLFAMN